MHPESKTAARVAAALHLTHIYASKLPVRARRGVPNEYLP